MEKNNQCSCTAAQWCPDENQMEPGHTCAECQKEEYRATSHSDDVEYIYWSYQIKRPRYTIDDDLPF